jgi:hypothetical protein
MSRTNIAITILFLLLVASNALWAAFVLRGEEVVIVPSPAAREREQQERIDGHRDEEAALFAAIEAAAAPGATRTQIIAAAQSARRGQESLCMESPGMERVGRIGLRFDDAGRLTGATTIFCPP